MSETKLMPLTQALHVLSEAHTRDDDLTGFVVMSGGGGSQQRGKDDASEQPSAPHWT